MHHQKDEIQMFYQLTVIRKKLDDIQNDKKAAYLVILPVLRFIAFRNFNELRLTWVSHKPQPVQ